MKKLITILQGLGLTLLTLLIVGVTWFAFSLVSDGLSASLMRFEGEPPEGWAYWRKKLFYESLPGNLAFSAMMLTLACLVGLGWRRFLLRLHRK